MNPAIEYILRDNKVRNMFSLPCSLFLNKENGDKLIITIQNTYGFDILRVNHWNLMETQDRFPCFTEFKINKSELFTSPYVILSDCTLLDYEEEPFSVGGNQSTDITTGLQQQMDFEQSISNFYNSFGHRKQKHDWLWRAFEVHIPQHILDHPYADSRHALRDVIQTHYKSWWFAWCRWKNFFLESKPVASELVFKNCFPEKQRAWNYFYQSSIF